MNSVAPAARIVEPPWLSVVIPAYDGARWIATALHSLAEQADAGIEIILVDGGPTGATVDAARTFSGRLRLRIVERPDLPSWQSKTNAAVQMAAAAHVCWLGVDDVWLPGRTDAVRDWIEGAPSVPLHLGASVLIDGKSAALGQWRCPLPSGEPLASSFVAERLLVQNFVAAPAPVFRRDAWLRAGGLDETLWYTADWDMWLKLASLGLVVYHDTPTIGFRVHRQSLTVVGNRDPSECERQMQRVVERHVSAAASKSPALERTALASIAVNLALAAAASGDWRRLPGAVWKILRLGPLGICRYLRDSRLLERALPRLRAARSGSL